MDVIDRLAGIIGENQAILTPIFRRQKNTSHHHHDSVTSLWRLLLTLLLLIFYVESKAWSNEMVIYLDGHMVEADISTRIHEGEVMVPVVAFCQFLNQELEIAIKVKWPAVVIPWPSQVSLKIQRPSLRPVWTDYPAT